MSQTIELFYASILHFCEERLLGAKRVFDKISKSFHRSNLLKTSFYFETQKCHLISKQFSLCALLAFYICPLLSQDGSINLTQIMNKGALDTTKCFPFCDTTKCFSCFYRENE